MLSKRTPPSLRLHFQLWALPLPYGTLPEPKARLQPFIFIRILQERWVGINSILLAYCITGIASKVFITVHVRRSWSAYFGSYFIPASSFVFISLLTLWLVYPKISVIINFLNVSYIIMDPSFKVTVGPAWDSPNSFCFSSSW